MRTTPVLKLLLASNLCLAAAAAAAQEPARAPALPENPLPGSSAPEPKQLPAAPSHDDLQACLKETGDYVTRGKTVLHVIGLANSCDRRLRCEIFANVTGARGTSLGRTIMTLGAAGSGPAARQTYSMHVKAAGGMAQISRECKVLWGRCYAAAQCSLAPHSLVIAGLDPAIHADIELGQTFGSALSGGHSAWIRGSSPRMTRESGAMRTRTVRYTACEIGRVRVIEDFLPPPADLVPREDNVKVTLSLSRRSLDFFKREAWKRRVPYQRMIRALVDTYAERQAGGRQDKR